MFLTRSHIWTSSAHRISWAVSLSFAFNGITIDPSLIIENVIDMTLYRLGVCGVVYSNVTFSFLNALCNFDWFSPTLSQRIYLTGVPRYVVFLKKYYIFLSVFTWFRWRNSRNNGCNRLLIQSSTYYQSRFPIIGQSCQQKYFLLAVTLLYKSFSSPHMLLPQIFHNHSKLVVFLLTWHWERYMLNATTFLPDVSTYEPCLCLSHLKVPTYCAILIFLHWCLFFVLVYWWVPLVLMEHTYLPSSIISCFCFDLSLRLISY